MANSKKADAVISPAMDALDLAGYNYASGRYTLDAKLHPDRLIFGSETFPHTIDENWKMVEVIDTLVGDFVWTAWDYLGENGIGAWSYQKEGAGFSKPYPWWLADTGAFDITGCPNAQAYWISAAWGQLEKPAITIQPLNHERKPYKAAWRGSNGIASYAWKNCEGKKGICEVFFKCDQVILYQNGKKIGSKKPKGSRTVFPLRYISGSLEAVAYDKNGREIARNVLQSTDDSLNLRLEAEEKEVSVNDIVYVNVAVADEKGIVESNHDVKVTIEAQNGELLAFGSANPCSEEDIHCGEYHTYYGKALAIIKATGAGTMKVKASAVSMENEITINVR